MTTLIIPDIHNKWLLMENQANEFLKTYEINHIIVLGDILNDWNSTPQEELESFEAFAQWIHEVRNHTPTDVLIGNHDLPYLVPNYHPIYSMIKRHSHGFIEENYAHIHDELVALNPQLSSVVYNDEGGAVAVASHAGISRYWGAHVAHIESMLPALTSTGDGSEFVLNEDHFEQVSRNVNSVLDREAWRELAMCGSERGGSDEYSSPLWAGLREISMNNPLKWQIVGHTPVRRRMDAEYGGSVLTCVDTWSSYRDGKPIGNRSMMIV